MDWKHAVFKFLTPEKTPHELLPKLFGPLRERYADRPGGYTRVLLIEPLKSDQAPSAILELVDGPKDMRFAMTARTVATTRKAGRPLSDMTERNIQKEWREGASGDGEDDERGCYRGQR
jgi:large subunit ribosomal protein L17